MQFDPAIERMRQCEHQVIVGHRQNRLQLLLAPGLLGLALALRAMAVTAGMILRLLEAALPATPSQATQGFGAALFDMPAGFLLNRGERMLRLIGGQKSLEDRLQADVGAHDGCSSWNNRSPPLRLS